ncbi:hypothetical protein BVX98_04140 [bacterium F11]|nr:hypothetical protein BVX98_04140 [bacterium F11]
MKPIIGITAGDPNGIGPEITLKAIGDLIKKKPYRFVLFGDYEFLCGLKNRLSKTKKVSNFKIERLSKEIFLKSKGLKTKGSGITCVDFKNVPKNVVKIGKSTIGGGRAAGEYIVFGIKVAKKGLIHSLVTAPINKFSFRMGGWGNRYVDHTEMLASQTGIKYLFPMISFKGRYAVQATAHIPLNDVSRFLTKKRIVLAIQLTWKTLKKIGIRNPKIAVCGLNPHAGDGGIIGKEETNRITPAIETCQKKGIPVTGPLSSDVVWPRVWAKIYDAGIAMYHDQGQIPMKLLTTRYRKSQKDACYNGALITMGLPFIRVTPFHGTAYDIAGKGLASNSSMTEAIEMASKLAQSSF